MKPEKHICYRCKLPIQIFEIEAFGRYWHKDCFFCDHCHLPIIISNSIYRDGFLLHVHCLPRERVSSDSLPDWLRSQTNQPATILNSSKTNAYQSIFTYIKCGICQKPIGEKYFVRNRENIFHKDCYLGQNDIRCHICNTQVRGKYLLNRWGEIYCYSHEINNPKCFYCGRPISNAFREGSIPYPDGKYMCNICMKSAINTSDDVLKVMDQVRDILGKSGLLVNEKLFPVKLVGQILEVSQLSNQESAVNGQFRARVDQFGNRSVENIYIIRGEPEIIFKGVLAHELGHAWFFINHIDGLEKRLEEGLCNLLAYLVISSKKNYESLSESQKYFSNPDPIYGTGFRIVEKYLYKYSIGSLMRYVSIHKKLPEL